MIQGANKGLTIWGTVFEGKAWPIEKASKGLVMSPEDQKRMSILAEYEGSSVHEPHGDVCVSRIKYFKFVFISLLLSISVKVITIWL